MSAQKKALKMKIKTQTAHNRRPEWIVWIKRGSTGGCATYDFTFETGGADPEIIIIIIIKWKKNPNIMLRLRCADDGETENEQRSGVRD